MLDRRESRSTTNRPGQIHGLARPEEREYNTRSRLLRVRIVRAKGLMKKDIFGTSDPYVAVILREGNGSHTISYGRVMTRILRNTLNPEWDETFMFRVRPYDQKLNFEVYDQNRITRDDFLGQLELSLVQIPTETENRVVQTRTYNLKPRSARSRVKGTIEVSLAYVVGEGWNGPQNEDEEEWDIVRDQEARESAVRTASVDAQTSSSSTSSPHASQSSEAFTPSALPTGWEERQDSSGRTFYVNHALRSTQWSRPVAEMASGHGSSAGIVPSSGPVRPLRRNDRDQSFRAISEQAARMYEMRRHMSQDDALDSTGAGRPATNASAAQPVTAVISEGGDNSTTSGPSATPNAPQAANVTDSENVEGAPTGARANDADDVLSTPLPPGWQMQTAANGRIFFIDHNRRTTDWNDPRTGKPTPLPADHEDPARRGSHADELGALPPGWEERVHEDGRVFYINHRRRTTQWDDPRLSDPSIAGPAVPYSRDYKRKYEYFRSHLRVPAGMPNKYDLRIRRSHLLEDSFNNIMASHHSDVLKTKLWIEFDQEVGLDYGGVSREFFYLISHEMFNPYYGLFEYSAIDDYTLQINPSSALCNEQHLMWFKFIGRVVGMAIFHGKLLDAFFIRPFYKMMLGKPITLTDMEAVDPEYFNSLKWILDNDPSVLDLRFTVDEEVMGATESIELKPGGEKTEVNNDNKNEYIDLVIKWRFVRRVEEQMKAFMSGFNELIPQALIQIFDPNELELLISGISKLDVRDWRNNTNYKGGYHANHLVIQWFWRAVLSFDNEIRSRLLQFITGTSRVPMNGFSELQGSNGPQRFTIEKWGTDPVALPRAHTCFNRLDLPPYLTYEQLVEKILMAIDNTEGFGGVD